MTYTATCDWSKCNYCGDCLVKCPVLQLDRPAASREIRALLEGEETPELLSSCTTCFNCNQYCPEGLRPHELILERFVERRQKNMPSFIPYLCNGRETTDTEPVMFQDLYSMLSEEEQAILESWSKAPEHTKELLWVGCIGRLSCKDLENSSVLKELPKFGPKDLCCGELAYRLHSWDAYSETIERTLGVIGNLDIDTMVCYCGSCYNYFTAILNKVYGKQLPFKVISLYEWLRNKSAAGEITLQKPLDFSAAVHESCYVTELGSEFPKVLRDVYSTAGMAVIELEHHGECNMSCGATTVLRDLNPYKSFFREHRRKYKELKDSGASELAVNCPGCYITLSFTKPVYRKKLRYMPDELLQAYGDEITVPIGKRVPLFIKAFLKRGPGLLKRVKNNNE